MEQDSESGVQLSVSEIKAYGDQVLAVILLEVQLGGYKQKIT